MSFHGRTHRHDGDGYTGRKNSTEESSVLLGSSHSPHELDYKRQQWPLLLIVIVVVETLILIILGSGIVYLLSKSSCQFPSNVVFCMRPMSHSGPVLTNYNT